jgi:hypothetical protein
MASDKNTRRSDEAERARHIAAGEAAAFATTAGTMLLGLVTEAEAAQHRSDPRQQQAPTPPSPPIEAAPTERTPANHGPRDADQHAGAFGQPATDFAPMIHADGAATTPSPDPAAGFDAAPAGEGVAPHVSPLSIPVWSFDALSDHATTAAENAGLGATTPPPSFDLGASIDQLANTITGLIDTSLATVSQAVASVSATVGQLTSSLSGTIGHLTDSLTGAVASVIDDAPAAATVEPLVSDLLGPTPTATDSSGASLHGASLLDSAGAVPTALLQPLPLQLGFLGQPTIDGHETHDGAFSALGVHHF